MLKKIFASLFTSNPAPNAAPPVSPELIADLKEFKKFCERGDKGSAEAILKRISEDPRSTEASFAEVCLVVFDLRRTVAYYEVLEEFTRRYPDSLFPIQPLWATALTYSQKFDEATAEARAFLRRVADAQLPAGRLNQPAMLHGIAAGHMTATAVYVETGAISYAIRLQDSLLNSPLELDPATRAWVANDRAQLIASLQDPMTAARDREWEMFWMSGLNSQPLIEICLGKSFTEHARRVELIAGLAAFTQKAPHFSQEYLLNLVSSRREGKSVSMLI